MFLAQPLEQLGEAGIRAQRDELRIPLRFVRANLARLPRQLQQPQRVVRAPGQRVPARRVEARSGLGSSPNDASFDSALRANRYRVSPNFTLYPTEFSKFRVQYNYDDRRGIGSDHSVWMQFEFLLGAHASHKF